MHPWRFKVTAQDPNVERSLQTDLDNISGSGWTTTNIADAFKLLEGAGYNPGHTHTTTDFVGLETPIIKGGYRKPLRDRSGPLWLLSRLPAHLWWALAAAPVGAALWELAREGAREWLPIVLPYVQPLLQKLF